MPWECTWITDWQEVCSEGGGGVLNSSILGTNTFDDQLASEDIVWTLFLRVRVCIRLLGVTIESILSGEISTRHWTGDEGAVAVVAGEECTNNVGLE